MLTCLTVCTEGVRQWIDRDTEEWDSGDRPSLADWSNSPWPLDVPTLTRILNTTGLLSPKSCTFILNTSHLGIILNWVKLFYDTNTCTKKYKSKLSIFLWSKSKISANFCKLYKILILYFCIINIIFFLIIIANVFTSGNKFIISLFYEKIL